MNLNDIPEAFQSKLRLAILSALVMGSKSFAELKRITEATDGNIGAQITKLESWGYVSSEKRFVGKKPLTTVSITEFGMEQFHGYVELLNQIISGR